MSIKRSSLEKRNNVTSSTIGQIHVLPIVEGIIQLSSFNNLVLFRELLDPFLYLKTA